MATSVPSQPTPARLARLAVGQPVSSAHGSRWAQDLAFLEAYALPPVAAATLPQTSATSPSTLRVAYARSPGCQLLLVRVQQHPRAAIGARSTITATLTGATWYVANGLDGTAELNAPPHDRRDEGGVVVGYLDVSGVTAGTVQDLAIVTANVADNPYGLREVLVAELPVAAVDPVGAPTTEVGVDGAWPSRDNPLYDGATDQARGFVRLWDRLDAARTKVRRHWQVCALEDTAGAFSCTATGAFGSVVFRPTTGADPAWRLRARALWGASASTPNRYTFRVRYRTANAGGTVKIRPVFNGVAGATLSVGGTTSWTAATVTVEVPTDGTDQEVTIRFEAMTDATAGTLYISQLALIEDEL